MRAVSLLVIAGCWRAPEAPAPAGAPVQRSEPPKLIVGHVALGWDGDHIAPALGTFARFTATDELAPGFEIALVGCVGLIGRAKLTTDEADGWRFELTARAQLWSPMRTCRTSEVLQAFAVSPPERVHDGGRGEVDIAAVYASLPQKLKKASTAEGRDAELVMWADLDADGEADLVELSAPCALDDAERCSVIASRETGTWRRIGTLR